MAAKKRGKKRKAKKRTLGRVKAVPRGSMSGIRTALRAVRGAKARIPPGTHRGGFALLHRIDSELSRLGGGPAGGACELITIRGGRPGREQCHVEGPRRRGV